MKSEQINELVSALAKVQSSLTPAIKNKKNPFFKSDYADLVAVWESCRVLLSANGLCVIQTTDHAEDGSTELITTLAHTSGQWIEGRYPIKAIKQDPQGVGSAITYSRRYALMAIVGIVTDDDDDGEHAMDRGKHHPTPKPPAIPTFIPDVTPKMKAIFEKNETEQIKAAVQSFIPEPLPFEESENPAPETVYVNGNTLIMFGKNKGKTFAELDDETLGKTIWGAEKGLSEGAEWVDRMGVQNVAQFVQQARAWLAKK